jgi:hypothetical protein
MAYPMATKGSKTADPAVGGGGAVTAKKPAKGGSWVKGLITLIVVLVIIGGGVYLISSYTGIGSGLLFGTGLRGDWQAVFLTNGQVYFGKVARINNETVVLRNIYYLQVVTQPLQRSAEGEVIQQEEQRLTLIKLGNEIHGPQDEMMINRSHVVIMEDLKSDSRVVQAINDYISQSGE